MTTELKPTGMFEAGHYYSPIPSKEEVREFISSRQIPDNGELPGIDMNKEGQLALLNDYIGFYKDLSFPERQTPGHRYYYENDFFTYSDAIFLYGFLRKHRPQRIIEVGSGFSSAAMLDTIDSLPDYRPEVAFIEPFPGDRLNALLRSTESSRVQLIDRKIQHVPSELFSSLQAGDLLFIDSSHVVKSGSDLQLLMFEILPRLQQGVFVHFHDVFFPFDYPDSWLLQGRYWNENYFLRAFLSWNSAWQIRFFNTYMHFMFGSLLQEMMPLSSRNTGGSLYIQRVK